LTWRHVQILNVLEAVTQVTEEGVAEVLQHTAFADDISYTLRAYHCYTASVCLCGQRQTFSIFDARAHTFILADVLERKLVAIVLPLNDAHLAEGALAHNAQ
jgi:hypothetical protein